MSKSAPTGEYLSTGSFMIRGKKNYLPPSHLILGFGILFKLGDDCLENHKNERRVRTLETEVSALSLSTEDTQSTVCYLSLKSKFFLSFLFTMLGNFWCKGRQTIWSLIRLTLKWDGLNFSHYTHPKNLEMIKFDSKICQITWERMNGDTILEPVWLSKHGLTKR